MKTFMLVAALALATCTVSSASGRFDGTALSVGSNFDFSKVRTCKTVLIAIVHLICNELTAQHQASSI